MTTETGLAGWGGRIRTSASGIYVPLALLLCQSSKALLVHIEIGEADQIGAVSDLHREPRERFF
jgi:hypothetical protein